MTSAAQRKGDSAEREIAKILSDQLGVTVRRKLGAGRMDDEGDLDGLLDTTVECKSFKDITRGLREGLDDSVREQANAGTTHGVAFIRRPWWTLVRCDDGGAVVHPVARGDVVSTGEPRLFAVEQEQMTSDDYYTPAWVFERMGIEFDLDVCAPPGGIPWIPAKRYFTQADDGLLQPWEGRVWMNPPWSQTSAWARKFIKHGNGVCLVPHAKSKWHLELWGAADGCAMPADGYFDFTGGSIFLSFWFAAFGDECVEAIGRLGTVRKIA